MTGIVCLDQEDGLLFNGRRQSRDRVVTEKILSMTEGKPLWMSAYSRRIFPEDAPVCVAEDLVGKLEELAESARKDAEQVESAQEELEREEAAQKKPWQQPGEAAFCLIEEAVNLENEMIDEWIVFRTCGQDKKFQARAEEIMKKEKWSKRHSSGFRKWLITVLLAISVLMTGYSVLKETGDVLLDQAKAWMEEGIDGARDEAGDDGDVASDKKCGGTSAAETPEDGFWGTEIPVYQGKAWIELNNNVPLFTKKDYSTKSFETYGELDSLGRCTTAYANVGQDLMPTKERESISQVKPTGWQKSEYDGIDGKFLYNRCHLIGYQLTAENANEKNLITGTRYLNVTGMLPFENMVADYVNETKGHVLYRVTPVFYQDELVARGVKMEGWSVEDNGEGVCFNVFVYNVQPGISICYADGTSSRIAQEETTDPSAQKIYGNRRSKIYHCPGQAAYEEMKDSPNLVIFDSEEQAQAAGYRKAVR